MELKPWSKQTHDEKRESLNYVMKIIGALLLVLAWFAAGIILVLPFLSMACFAFAFRREIANLGTRKEDKDRAEYARLKKKYGAS